ncbi:MAG: PSD1 and planctomycete cytochrome C domain-containing protein [Planctomycetales bacterium]|jgi:mono/diheme cytochrome c family protein
MTGDLYRPNSALLAAVILAGCFGPIFAADDSSAASVFYESAVAEIVKSRCATCHDAKRREGGLDLSSPTGLVAGGDSGSVIDRGQPEEGLLFRHVTTGEMPPDDEKPLTAKQIAAIREWIIAGTKFRTPPQQRQVSEHDVIPILLLRCTACHGTRRKEGGLDLRTRESILKGGKSGEVVVAGKPDESRLVQRVLKEEMPPRRQLVSVSVKPMTESERKTIEAWILAGLPEDAEQQTTGPPAADESPEPAISKDRPALWAFRPPRIEMVPPIDAESGNPIDAFVARKLTGRGLIFAPRAARLALLRRVYFDLIGLPPTPTEVDQFLADRSPDAWERLIDRLLASPRYGERWARHWLDAAGYADSEGAQNADRVRPHLWRYRDYVIRSFNDDKPYDQFLHEQIAGDELADYSTADEITGGVYDNLVATGFLRTTPDRTFANITNFVPDRLEVIADEMQVFSSAVLGLTLQCARCHDHKFDPLSQRDYYSLTAIFKDAYDEHDWLKSQGPRTLPHVTSAERTAWQQQIQRIDVEVADLQKKFDAEADEAKKAELKKKIDAANASKPAEPRIRALWSRGEPSPTYLLRRGNYLTPGPLVKPNVPTVLAPAGFEFQPTLPGNGSSATGRRLALAQWLTRPEHPLTARVLVNRVWKQHFGRGIVATVGNFGTAGERPSHPELLDWLAIEFVRHDWSIKWLHRQMLTSRTWQQSSFVREAVGGDLNGDLKAGAGNLKDGAESSVSEEERVALLHGAPLRRMEAEVVRDTLLSVAGHLDLKPFGTPDGVTARPDGLVTSVRTAAGWRRSIFVLQRRTKIPTLLENFDSPQMGPNCLERNESIVAPQALHLLNNEMVHELAGHFSDRVIDAPAGQTEEKAQAQVRSVYRLGLSRFPTAEEQDAALEALAELQAHWRVTDGATDESAARKALASFCHAIMNSAEFLYID